MTEKLKALAFDLSNTTKTSRSDCFHRLNVLSKIISNDDAIIELVSKEPKLLDQPIFGSLLYVLQYQEPVNACPFCGLRDVDKQGLIWHLQHHCK